MCVCGCACTASRGLGHCDVGPVGASVGFFGNPFKVLGRFFGASRAPHWDARFGCRVAITLLGRGPLALGEWGRLGALSWISGGGRGGREEEQEEDDEDDDEEGGEAVVGGVGWMMSQRMWGWWMRPNPDPGR